MVRLKINLKDPKKKKKLPNKDDGDDTPEISKIGESAIDFIKALEELANPKKGATAPEPADDKESKKGKEFKALHKTDELEHDDMEKIEKPKEVKVKKESKLHEYEVIRQILSGQKPE